MSDAMIFGAFLPQGWKMELAAIDGAEAKWAKAVEIAVLAEELGYDSIWVYDHFHNVPRPGARGGLRVLDDDRRASASARAASASGQMVGCNSYRQPSCWPRSPRRSTSSAAAASTGASAPAGTRTSTRATATSSPCQGAHRHAAGVRRDREVDVDRAGDDLRRPLLPSSTARTATPSRCSSRTLRSGSVAAASSSPCGSSPATPTRSNFGGKPDEFAAQVRAAEGHCKDVGRDYDEIRKTWSPEVFVRETEAEVKAAGSRSFWGEPVESWTRGQPRRHPRPGRRKHQHLPSTSAVGHRPLVLRLPRHRDADASRREGDAAIPLSAAPVSSGVVAEHDLGDARRLGRALDLEHELHGHLRAAGHVLDAEQLRSEPHLRADRYGRGESHLVAARSSRPSRRRSQP